MASFVFIRSWWTHALVSRKADRFCLLRLPLLYSFFPSFLLLLTVTASAVDLAVLNGCKHSVWVIPVQLAQQKHFSNRNSPLDFKPRGQSISFQLHGGQVLSLMSIHISAPTVCSQGQICCLYCLYVAGWSNRVMFSSMYYFYSLFNHSRRIMFDLDYQCIKKYETSIYIWARVSSLSQLFFF